MVMDNQLEAPWTQRHAGGHDGDHAGALDGDQGAKVKDHIMSHYNMPVMLILYVSYFACIRYSMVAL